MYMGYEFCLQFRYATNVSERHVKTNVIPERDGEGILFSVLLTGVYRETTHRGP